MSLVRHKPETWSRCEEPLDVPQLGDIALWRIYVFQFEYLWFLQSLFVIFLVVGILDSVSGT